MSARACDTDQIPDGFGKLTLSITDQGHVLIGGIIRLYLSKVESKNQVKIVIMAPKEVRILRSQLIPK